MAFSTFTDSERLAEIRRLIEEHDTMTFQSILDEPYSSWIPETLVARELGLTAELTRKLIQLEDHVDDDDYEPFSTTPLRSEWMRGCDGRKGFYLVKPSSVERARELKARLPAVRQVLELQHALKKIVPLEERAGDGGGGPLRLYGVEEAARALEISPTRVRQLISAGMIDARKMSNGEYQIEDTEIQRRLAERLAAS